jgi:hypothetical protein
MWKDKRGDHYYAASVAVGSGGGPDLETGSLVEMESSGLKIWKSSCSVR